MLCNGWKEAKDKSVELHTWDMDTVTKMVQWLYTDDYDNPLPKTFIPETDESRSKGMTDPTCMIIPTPVPTGEVALREAEANLSKISQDGNGCLAFNKMHIQDVKPQASLMNQAKVYAIAEYAQLPGLTRLASERFYILLDYIGRCTITEMVAEDMVDIVQYVNAHTRARTGSKLEQEDVLRKHILSFVGAYVKYFKGPKSLAMIWTGGDLAADIWSKTTKLSSSPNKRPIKLEYEPRRKVIKTYTEAK